MGNSSVISLYYAGHLYLLLECSWLTWSAPTSLSMRWACRCGCGTSEMDPEFMRMLQELRDQMQGPLRVSRGRRCDHHNDAVSTAKNKKKGVHTLGQASDILISGERAMLLFEKARKIGFSGIGLSQRGPHQDRFVHLDTKPRKALWSYWALI